MDLKSGFVCYLFFIDNSTKTGYTSGLNGFGRVVHKSFILVFKAKLPESYTTNINKIKCNLVY